MSGLPKVVSTVYGSATQPGSPHIGDGLTLSAEKRLRLALVIRNQIEANLEARDMFEMN